MRGCERLTYLQFFALVLAPGAATSHGELDLGLEDKLDELAFEVPLSLVGLRGAFRWAYWLWQVFGSFGWIAALAVYLYGRYRGEGHQHYRPEVDEDEGEDDGAGWRLVGSAGNGRRPRQQEAPRPPARLRRSPVNIQGLTVPPAPSTSR